MANRDINPKDFKHQFTTGFVYVRNVHKPAAFKFGRQCCKKMTGD